MENITNEVERISEGEEREKEGKQKITGKEQKNVDKFETEARTIAKGESENGKDYKRRQSKW